MQPPMCHFINWHMGLTLLTKFGCMMPNNHTAESVRGLENTTIRS